MIKINYKYIVDELNNNCLHKDEKTENEKWSIYDITLEDDWTKSSCYTFSKGLCVNCSKILNKYIELYKIIIETSICTFNKVLEHNHQYLNQVVISDQTETTDD